MNRINFFVSLPDGGDDESKIKTEYQLLNNCSNIFRFI